MSLGRAVFLLRDLTARPGFQCLLHHLHIKKKTHPHENGEDQHQGGVIVWGGGHIEPWVQYKPEHQGFKKNGDEQKSKNKHPKTILTS